MKKYRVNESEHFNLYSMHDKLKCIEIDMQEAPAHTYTDEQWDDEEPPPLREDYLFLDEEQDELESKYGCPMVELDEDELLEIVEQFVKLTPESAKWEENMQGIKYKYQEECA